MDHLTPIASLPIMSPWEGTSSSMYGQREDGSFDFTQFFASFDLNSDVAKFWANEFDPGKFLAELRMACSPPPPPLKGTSSRFSRRRSEPSPAAVVAYQAQLDERRRAKEAVDKELAALDEVVNKMNAVHVPGVEELKKDFAAAKAFIFDAVAHSNSRALEFHLESIEDLAGTPSLPSTPYTRAPHLGPIDLPVMTPLASTPSEPAEKWPSILTGATGLAYRIVATPLDLPVEAMNYFRIVPPTPLHDIKREWGSQSSTSSSPKSPGFGNRPSSSWIRGLSGFGSAHIDSE